MAQTIPRAAATVTGAPFRSGRPRHRRPNRRLTGLAGIAIAVLTASNLGLPLSGGYLAMDVLLVCIGFDTARKLRGHADEEQRLRRYWLNEVTPMIAPVLLAVALSALYWNLQGQLGGPQVSAVLGGLTMTLNLFVIFGNAELPIIEHLWAIGVIVQFFLVAPVLVWGLRRRLNANGRAAMLLGMAGGIAVCRLGFLLTEAADAGSIAINPLTRADALLAGLVIGVAPLGTLRRRIPIDLAPPALAMLLLLFIAAPDPAAMPLVALGVMLVAAIGLSAMVIAWIATGGVDSALSRTLDNRMLQWLGKRALSIYIWHQLFGLIQSADGFGPVEQMHEWPRLWVFIARVVFSLAAAATSHRYLELPTAMAAKKLLSRPAKPKRRARTSTEISIDMSAVTNTAPIEQRPRRIAAKPRLSTTPPSLMQS